MEYPDINILSAILQDNANQERNFEDGPHSFFLRILTAEKMHAAFAQWPKEKQHTLFDCVVAAEFCNQSHMFTHFLVNNFPSGMNFPELTRYMMTITSSLLGDKYQFHEATASVRWIYQSALLDEVNLDDAKRFVTEFGELGELSLLDTCYRRMLDDAKYPWVDDFCSLLTEGMLKRLKNPTKIWDIVSPNVINQDKPEHYSRQSILWRRVDSYICLGITYYADQQMRLVLEELAGYYTPKRFKQLKKKHEIPEPEE